MFKEIENLISKLARNESIFFKQHCVERMIERDITSKDIQQALLNCEIISVYPEDRPLLSYLILGYDKSKKPLHIVAAISKDKTRLWLITVYRPDVRRWSKDFRERK